MLTNTEASEYADVAKNAILVIDTVVSRGAIRGEEMVAVGMIRQNLESMVARFATLSQEDGEGESDTDSAVDDVHNDQ